MVASIDTEALRRKYAAERDKRLRPDGNDQYLRLTGELAHYRDDPYTPRTERAAITDHRTVVCVGGGFAGLVAAARLREAGVDVRIIEKGSGFEVGTPYARRAGFEVTGRDGRTLSEHWADGMRTLHGIHVRGFPNLLFVQPTQGANLISNVPHNIVDSARTITAVVRHATGGRFGTVEPSAGAETAWVELLLTGPGSMIGGPDCTPGYYNNEGQDPGQFLGYGYPYGPSAYFTYIDKWRASGTFDGLEFR